MAIPKTFRLGGRTWTVKRGVPSKKWYGRTHHTKCLIEISTFSKSPEEELHTFYHELLHAIAGTMGWTKFNRNEDKIDAMASLLLQVTESSEG
jgi:Zn-dependent peptidase ImmA (M78 family)